MAIAMGYQKKRSQRGTTATVLYYAYRITGFIHLDHCLMALFQGFVHLAKIGIHLLVALLQVDKFGTHVARLHASSLAQKNAYTWFVCHHHGCCGYLSVRCKRYGISLTLFLA